jgi:hypothetical protein
MIVFGGYASPNWMNDTWELSLSDAPQWSEVSPGGFAPRRVGHSAIYDPVRDRMIVFGGLDSTGAPVNDVWALSFSGGTAWTKLAPSGAAPSPRCNHTALYDPIRDRMLIFGGWTGSGTWYNDAWSLSLGSSPAWDSLSALGPAPARRSFHSAIYDPVRDRMVVFSGYPVSNDVWTLSLGSSPAWNELSPTGSPPSQRQGHTAIYDPARDAMVVFGGNTLNQPLQDSWALDLGGSTNWYSLAPTAAPPSPRSSHSSVYDPVYRRMVIFGGTPDGGDQTYALSLRLSSQWRPFRAALELSTRRLTLPRVTLGDTVSAELILSSVGMEPVQVAAIDGPHGETSLQPPAPATLGWDQSLTETIAFAPTVPRQGLDSLSIATNDSIAPREVYLDIDALPLAFDTRLLGAADSAELATSLIVITTPRPGVHVERGHLYYRVAGGSAFDSLSLTPLGTDFIAAIPASAVTESGVDYYVRVENSPFESTQPPGAPAAWSHQRVAPPLTVVGVPQPTSGASFVAGREIRVEVLLPSGSSFVSGELDYRSGGDRDWGTRPLEASGVLGQAIGIIPADVAGSRGVEYRLEVSTLTRTLRFPADSSAAVIPIQIENLREPSIHPGGRYRLLGVPLDFGDYSGRLDGFLADQLGPYDVVRWRLYAYDGSSQRNVELSSVADSALFHPRPGSAFWLISRDPHRVDTYPLQGVSTRTVGDYAIALEPGWNLIADPFDFPVAWADVRRDSDAVQNPVAFDPSSGAVGDYRDQPATLLVPFEGYFVHASQPTTIRVPPRVANVGGLDATAETAETDAGWRLRFEARTDRARDGSNVFGVRAASEPFEPLEWLEPPHPPGPWVGAAFVRTEDRERVSYRRDLREAGGEGQTWEVQVQSSQVGEPITIELSPSSTPLPEIDLRLIDREQGTVIDFSPRCCAASATRSVDSTSARFSRLVSDPIAPRYRIVSFGSRPYRLAIVAGSADYVHEIDARAPVPRGLTLDPVAPNPVRLATRVHFGLPRATPVTLEIYSVLGQRVATLLERESLEAGFHSVVWDRSARHEVARSGVYFLRLTAGTESRTAKILVTN